MIKPDVSMVSHIMYACAVLYNLILDIGDLIPNATTEIFHILDEGEQMLQDLERMIGDETFLIQNALA